MYGTLEKRENDAHAYGTFIKTTTVFVPKILFKQISEHFLYAF